MGNAKENFTTLVKYEDKELCKKDCDYIDNNTPVAKRWLNGEAKYTAICIRYKRLIECVDIGFGGKGPTFVKCKKCRIDEEKSNESTKN